MRISTTAIGSELFPSACFFDDIAVTVSVANPESLLILSSFPSYSSADSITSDSSLTGKVTSLLQVGAANPMLRGKSDAARASLTGYESAPPPSLELLIYNFLLSPFTSLFNSFTLAFSFLTSPLASTSAAEVTKGGNLYKKIKHCEIQK